jgi:hypothetical protein
VLTGETFGSVEETMHTQLLYCKSSLVNVVQRGVCPLCSPDRNTPDNFLYGFLEENVYLKKPQSLEELKHSTEQNVANTDSKTLPKSHDTH